MADLALNQESYIERKTPLVVLLSPELAGQPEVHINYLLFNQKPRLEYRWLFFGSSSQRSRCGGGFKNSFSIPFSMLPEFVTMLKKYDPTKPCEEKDLGTIMQFVNSKTRLVIKQAGLDLLLCRHQRNFANRYWNTTDVVKIIHKQYATFQRFLIAFITSHVAEIRMSQEHRKKPQR